MKVDPIHIFVPDIFADLPGINRDKVFEDCYICILTTLCYTYISENMQYKCEYMQKGLSIIFHFL